MENKINRNKTQSQNRPHNYLSHIPSKFKSKIILLCTIIAIVIGLLITSIIVLPTIHPFKQYILTYVDNQASLLLLCNVSIGKVSVDIPNGIVIKNVVLSDPRSKRAQLVAERVSAKINILPLLRGRVELHSLNISGLRGELVNSTQGLFAGPVDITKISAPPKNQVKTADSLKPIVQIIYAERCTVSYTDSIAKLAAFESIVSLHMKFIRADSIDFVLHAGEGRFASPVWSGGVRKNIISGAVGPVSIHFGKADVFGDSLELSVSGTIPFTMEKVWNLKANARAYVSGFRSLYKKTDAVNPVGQIKVSAEMNGSMVKPVLDMEFAGYGMLVNHIGVDSMALIAKYSKDILLTKANVWSVSGTANANVWAHISHLFMSPIVGPYTVAAVAEKINLRSLMPSVQWKGHGPVFVTNAEIYGGGSGVVNLPDTMYAQIKQQTGMFAQSPAGITMICAKNKWNLAAEMKPDVNVKGTGTYTDSGAINGTINVAARSLKQIASVLKKDSIDGSLAADIDIHGTIKNPSVSSRISMGPSFYDGYSIDTLFTQNEFADKKLQWQSFTIARNSSMMKSAGSVSFAKNKTMANVDCNFLIDHHDAGAFSANAKFNKDSLDITARGNTIDPSAFSPWFPQAKQLQGGLNIHATLAGIYKNPDMQCTFVFDHPVSNGLALLASGDASYTNGIATAKIFASQKDGGHQLSVTAHVPLAMQGLSKGASAIGNGAKVTISGDSVAYGSLINAFIPSIQSKGTISVHGTLVKEEGIWAVSCSTHLANNELIVKREKIKVGDGIFDLYVHGPLARPAARFSVSGTSIEYRGNVVDSYNGHGSMDNSKLTLDTLHISAKGGELGLSATVPLTIQKGFSFNNNALVVLTINALPLGTIQPFLPDLITINKGIVSGQINVEGKNNGFPQAKGALSIKNAELFVGDCNKSVGPLFADIVVLNDSILLENLQAKWGGGSVTGNGYAVLGAKGVSTAKAKVNIKNVHAGGCYENLDLGINTADITLTKDSLVSIIANAQLADTRFIQDFSLLDLSQQIKKKTPQAVRLPNPLFKTVEMRISVDLNNNLTFDSNLGKMLVDGNVTVAGRPDKPEVNAQLQITNGFVYYLDRKFTVTNGLVRQYDPQKINPALDISATATVSWYPPQGGKEDYDITILVKDNLSNPLITLSANPTLTQPQIVSLLTLGTIQTGMGSDLGSRTGSLVGQQLAGFGTRKLARLLSLESIDIYGNVFGPSSEGPQLSVSKQLSSRINVTYKKGLSNLSQQMVLVSYRILSFLYLEAESDQQAQGGVDLKFRYSK